MNSDRDPADQAAGYASREATMTYQDTARRAWLAGWEARGAALGDVTVQVVRHGTGAVVEVRCAGGPPRHVWAPEAPTPLDDEYLGTEGGR